MALLTALALFICASPPARALVATGENAVAVIGQGGSYTTSTANYGSSSPTITDGMNANNVLGQGGSYTTSTAATTSTGMKGPAGVALDAVHHRLFVAEATNNRVLEFNLNTDDSLPDATADHVLGQSVFTGSGSGTTSSTMKSPEDVAYDATNDRLFVADNGNNRVLVFNTATITDGMAAANVLGQTGFNAGTANAGSAGAVQNGMSGPYSIGYDATDNFLFVADYNNNRVLVFDTAAITNGENATHVLGQSLFTTSTAATTQSGMSSPTGVAYDATNHRLFVEEYVNNRVTVFDTATITDGENAVHVLGQSLFTTNTAATTQSGMNGPFIGLAYDATDNFLFVSDANNRVTVFDTATITDGENAVHVLGQSLFTTNTAATTQSGMKLPAGLAYDATNDRLFVADYSNNRVLEFKFVAAITVVQKTGTGGSGCTAEPCTLAFTSNNTLHNALIIYGDAQARNSTITISDTLGNTYTTALGPITDNSLGNTATEYLWYVCDAKAGANTVSISSVGHTKDLAIEEVSGLTTTNCLDQKNSTLGASSGTATTSGNVTTTQASEILFGATNTNGAGCNVLANEAGWTQEVCADGYETQDIIVSATGTYASTLTLTGGTSWTGLIATFKAGAGGGGTTNATGLDTPDAVAFDKVNHRLFVADYNNNRVLVYNLNADNSIPDDTADNVLGQANFTSNSAATTQAGMNHPTGLAFDAGGNRLFVAEYNNSRVLVFNTSTITNGMNAANVLGQANFTSSANATTQAGMNGAHDVAYDAVNNRLLVADYSNNRVLVFNTSTITNGMNAANELGQPSGTAFTSSTAATTQAGMKSPAHVAYDATNNRLFVTDWGNNRVLAFDTSSITNGENALHVLGQANFTSSTPATTQSGMSGPHGIAYDATNNRLFLAEFNNTRVLVYGFSNAPTDGMNADSVLGQANFTSSSSATTQAGMNNPIATAYDPTTEKLFVADQTNNRVTVYDASYASEFFLQMGIIK